MRCERVKYLYDEYSQGALSVPTMARVEEHLAACPLCREYYEQSDAIAKLVRRASEVAHPSPQYFDELNDRVLAALDQPETLPDHGDPARILTLPASQWRRPLWWAGGLAAAALVALGVAPELLTTAGDSVASNPDMPAGKSWTQANANPYAIQPLFTPLADAPMFASLNPRPTAETYKIKLRPGQAQSAEKPADIAVAALDLGGAPHFNSTTLDKGKAGIQNNQPEVEQMIAAAGGSANKRTEPERNRTINANGTNTVAPTELQLASVAASFTRTLPPEIYAKAQLLTQNLDRGPQELRNRLRRLSQLVGEDLSEQTSFNAIPVVRQAQLYLKAEDALAAGRIDDSFRYYRQVFEACELSPEGSRDNLKPLAQRVNLPLGDLYYSEYGNFSEADKNYRLCQAAGASTVFSATEREYIKRQLERLEEFKANDWAALQQMHNVLRGDWPNALAALHTLIDLPGTDKLLPETARAVVDRLEKETASPEVATQLYNLLESKSQGEQNVEIRAWLDLALGDLAYNHLGKTEIARDCYQRTVAAAANSGAANLARTKLIELRDRNLSDSVRNRN